MFVNKYILSKTVLADLGIIDQSFPNVLPRGQTVRPGLKAVLGGVPGARPLLELNHMTNFTSQEVDHMNMGLQEPSCIPMGKFQEPGCTSKGKSHLPGSTSMGESQVPSCISMGKLIT